MNLRSDLRRAAALLCLTAALVAARAALVRLFRKGQASPFQVLRLPNVELYRDTAAYSPKTGAKPRMIYEEEYSFVFEDFNFDGWEDLAVCNGRNGGYGGPSYTIFLFDKNSGRFVENRRLSELNEGVYLGLFFPDPKKKLLVTYSKSGCCYHETEMYRVVNGRPVLAEKIIEDATGENGAGQGFVLVTTRKRVNGRWIVTRRKEKLKEDGGPD